jgi:hypothetical protein
MNYVQTYQHSGLHLKGKKEMSLNAKSSQPYRSDLRLQEPPNRLALNVGQWRDWQNHVSVPIGPFDQHHSSSLPPTFEISPRYEARCSVRTVAFYTVIGQSYLVGARSVQLC